MGVGPTSAGAGCAHCVPLLHQLSASHHGNRDVYQADVAALVLLPLPVGVLVEVEGEGSEGGQAAEVEALPPEDVVALQLAGGASVQAVVQTQLAEVPADKTGETQASSIPATPRTPEPRHGQKQSANSHTSTRCPGCFLTGNSLSANNQTC